MKSSIIICKLIIISLICFGQSIFAQSIIRHLNVYYKNPSDSLTEIDNYRLTLDIGYITPIDSIINSNFKKPTVIFVYGGGLKTGTKYLPGKLLNSGYITIAPNYRLSPNVKCPTYIEDIASAIAWVFKNIESYGGDTTKIYLVGSSAGAYLCNMVFWDKSYLAKYNIDPDIFAGFFSISSQLTTHYVVSNENGLNVYSGSTIIDKFAPLYHVRHTNTPITFYIGDRKLDEPGRFIQNSSMIDTLKNLGCKKINLFEFIGFPHGRNLEYAALDSIVQIINKSEVQSRVKNSYSDESIFRFKDKIVLKTNYQIDDIVIYNYMGRIIKQIKYLSPGTYSYNLMNTNKLAIVKYFIRGEYKTKKI